MDYTIKAGDTLSNIAKMNNTDVASIASLNKIPDVNKIQAGATIKIPTNLTTPTKTDPTKLGGFTLDTSKITTADATTPATRTDAINYAKNISDAFTNYQKNMQDYQNKILGYMQPGTEEQALQKEVLGLQQSDREKQLAEQGAVLGLEGQGRGITTGLVRGQQAQLQRQQALEQQKRSMDILAKSESLQALTGIRKTALDVAKEALGFENTSFEKILGVQQALQGLDKTEKEQARQDLINIMEFSKGKSFEELDPQSQQAIIDATANTPYTLGQVKQTLERYKLAVQDEQAKAMKDRLISVGENSRLYDPVSGRYIGGGVSSGVNGNTITTVKGQPTQIGELKQIAGVLSSRFKQKFAQESFNAQVNNFIQKGDSEGLAYYLRSTAAGQIPGAEMQQKYVQNIEILKGIDRLSSIMDTLEANGVDTNIFSGTAQSIKNKIGALGDPNLVNLAQQALNIRDIIARLRTGAALTKTEEEMYKKMTPSIFRTASLNKTILDNLKTNIQSSTDSYLGLSISPKQSETLNTAVGSTTTATGKTKTGNSYTITSY